MKATVIKVLFFVSLNRGFRYFYECSSCRVCMDSEQLEGVDRVWTEVKVGSEGVSVSLYSETDGRVSVEDEWWATSDEIDVSNETVSLE